MVATALGGCGGSTEDEAVSTGSEQSAGTDPADTSSDETPDVEESEEAVIERAAFCDRIDPTLIENALGAPSQWLEERKPGDTYEIFGQKQKSESYYCRWQTNQESGTYGADDATMAVTIHGKSASTDFVNAEIIERAKYLKESGKELGCAEAEAAFGDPSWSQVCAFEGDRYNDPNSSATVVGLFGDSLVTCYVQRNGPGDSEPMRAVLDDVCGQLPLALGSS